MFGNFPNTAPHSPEWSWIDLEYLGKNQRKECKVVSLKEAAYPSGQRIGLSIQVQVPVEVPL